mgnify:CR=1 FL=1
MSLLQVKNLVVEFPSRHGTLRALDDISFDIAPGEILGVVGESGAGKSLTGASIIGLLEPPGRVASGQIVLEGQRIDHLNADQMRHIRGRKIGAIFQDPLTSLNPLYTIGRQLVETIQAHLPVNGAEARQRAIQLLKDTGISAADERIDHYPHQFSGGMRQRVMIAMALSCEPALLIADEPTTALDVTIQAQILDLLAREQQRRHMAMILITHDLGVVAEVADRVAVMYAGQIVEDATLDDLFYDPQHPYTWGLLGSLARLDQPDPDRIENRLRPGVVGLDRHRPVRTRRGRQCAPERGRGPRAAPAGLRPR